MLDVPRKRHRIREEQIMAKRRGGYSGDKQHALKFRASPSLFEQLQAMSEEKGMAMAMLLRQLVSKGLEQGWEQPTSLSRD